MVLLNTGTLMRGWQLKMNKESQNLSKASLRPFLQQPGHVPFGMLCNQPTGLLGSHPVHD